MLFLRILFLDRTYSTAARSLAITFFPSCFLKEFQYVERGVMFSEYPSQVIVSFVFPQRVAG